MTGSNDSAFPGLTKREYLASRAVEGILIGMFADRPTTKPTPEKVAAMAIAYADALIAGLNEPPQ